MRYYTVACLTKIQNEIGEQSTATWGGIYASRTVEAYLIGLCWRQQPSFLCVCCRGSDVMAANWGTVLCADKFGKSDPEPYRSWMQFLDRDTTGYDWNGSMRRLLRGRGM